MWQRGGRLRHAWSREAGGTLVVYTIALIDSRDFILFVSSSPLEGIATLAIPCSRLSQALVESILPLSPIISYDCIGEKIVP
jgi:hypothetical protein